MILVPLFDLKFLNELAAGDVGTSNRPALVPRFRSSWYIAAFSRTNFGSEGALASIWI